MNRRSFVPLVIVFTAALVLWLVLRTSAPDAPNLASKHDAHPEATAPATAPPNQAEIAPPPAHANDERTKELARLLAISDPDERFRRLDEFWRSWFASDRDGVFAAIAGLPSGDERAQALAYALLELAKTEPDRALELALLLVSDEQDAHLFASLFDAFARSDLALARERLARVPVGLGFEPAWRAYTDAFARTDLDAALRWAAAQSASPARTLALETALYSLAEKDPFAAFELAMEQLVGEARDRSLYQALTRIIPHDPAAASALIVAMPASPQRAIAVVDAARAWADDAPGLALDWATSLPAESASESEPTAALATANILEIWVREDPAAALAALANLPAGEGLTTAAERVATVLALASPEAALDWAATLPDPVAQDRAITTSVTTWAREDPAAAATWTLARGVTTDQGALFGEVISYWAVQDLPAAAEHVRKVGDPTAQKAGELALAHYLARAESDAAQP